MIRIYSILFISFVIQFIFCEVAHAFEVKGHLKFDQRHYLSSSTNQLGQDESILSFQGELYHRVSDIEILIEPYIRLNSFDSEKGDAYFKEFNLSYSADEHEVKLGISQVYWGITESQHIIDIINQTDTLYSIDLEEKYGQPMIQYTYYTNEYALQLFWLHGFKQQNFATDKSRLRPAIPVDISLSQFESKQGESHNDFAVKLSGSLSALEYSFHYFKGTERTPYFYPSDTSHSYFPYYAQMEQFGIESLSTFDNWIFKFEGFRRHSLSHYSAFTTGYEYTFIGIFDTQWDINLINEYQYDSRKNSQLTQGQNDLFIAAKIAFNDIDDTTLLIGFNQDLDRHSSQSAKIEASGRINDYWSWEIEGWFFKASSADEITYAIHEDDFIQFSLAYYF